MIESKEVKQKIKDVLKKGITVPLSNPELDLSHVKSINHLSQNPSSIINREIGTKDLAELTDAMLQLFKEDASDLPTCKPYVRAFVSAHMEGVLMAAELPCGSWKCAKCGPRLKLNWYFKLLKNFIETEHLEKVLIDKNDWDATRKAIHRAGGAYSKMEQKSGFIQIFTNAELGGQSVSQKDREEALISTLINTAFTSQPISKSRNWSKNAPSTEEKIKNWVPLDSLKHKTIEETVEQLDKLGIKPVQHSIYSRTHGAIRAITFHVDKDRFWDVIWKLGAMARNAPSKGPRESREIEWISPDKIPKIPELETVQFPI